MESKGSISVLDWLRFPLAVAVVFIHSYGNPPLCASCVASDPCAQDSIFALFRVLFSRALPSFAVPLFFLISGCLFFYQMDDWSWKVYGNKLRRRVRRLLLPYILWIALYALHLSPTTVGGVLAGAKPLSALWLRFHAMGGWHIFWDSHLFGHTSSLLLSDVYSTGPLLAPLWFVRDLMVLVLFAPLFYQLVKRFRWLPLAVVAVCHLANVWIPVSGFSASSTLWFLLGATFGICGKDIVSVGLRWRKWGGVVAFVLLVPLVWLQATKVGCSDFPKRLLITAYGLAAITAVVGFVEQGLRKDRLHPRPFLSKSSFFVYASHIFLLTSVMRQISHIGATFPLQILAYLLTPLATVVACLALYFILDRLQMLLRTFV